MAVFTAIGATIFGTGTFLAGLTAAALQIAAGIGVSLIGKALAGEPEKSKFGVQGTLQGGDDVPRSILFGYNCTAGSLVYGNTWGIVDGLPNAYLTQVIALADYPIRELLSVEVNGAMVTLGPTVEGNKGYPVTEFFKNGKNHLWIKFYDGTQVTADTFLTGTVSSAERPYTSTRVGRGVPYIIATSMAHQREDGEEEPLFSGGFPRFKFVTNGSKLYDITKDTTAGGSGSQLWDDPSTWGGDGDFLPAVQIYNLLRGIRFNDEWLYGLQNLPAARLPNDSWIAVINKCRATITGASGLEPTYRTGGEIQVGAQIKFSIESILTGCQGRLTEIGGIYKLHVGEAGASVASFEDEDIISTQDQSFTPFFSLEDTINGILAKYPNPEESWNIKTSPPLIRTDLEALDGNRRLMADVTLDMVPYAGQVQRLSKSALLEAQRARRHTITMGPEFWILEPGDVIEWTSERNGYISKLFRIDGMSDQPNLDVLFDLTEIDPADYDWNQETDYRPVTNLPIAIVGTPPLPMIGWQVYAVAIQDELGRDRRPAIEVWYDSAIQDVDRVKFQVRRYGFTDIFLSGEVPYGSPWRTVIQGDFPADAEFEVRGIFVRASGGNAEWSDWLYVKTLNVKLISGVDFDPYEGGPDLEDLSDDLKGLLKFVGTSLREVVENAQALATRAAEQDLGQQVVFQQLRREASVNYGLLTSNYTESITVLAGYVDGQFTAYSARLEELEVTLEEDFANAIDLIEVQIDEIDGVVTAQGNAITSINSVVGDNSSGGLLRIYSVANESGASATIALSVSASNDPLSPPNTAGLFLSAVGGGVSRVTIAADQFVVQSPAGPTNPLVYDGVALRLNVANIGTINAGLIQNGTGTSFWNLNTGAFRIST